eukprot:359079-Amphidinium_carterae.1
MEELCRDDEELCREGDELVEDASAACPAPANDNEAPISQAQRLRRGFWFTALKHSPEMKECAAALGGRGHHKSCLF